MNDLFDSTDEDPFRCVQRPARFHRTSLVNKWISEQQQDETLGALQTLGEDEELPPRSETPAHPFLAYPDIPRLSLDFRREDMDVSTLHNYDLVDDDDIPETAEVCVPIDIG